MKKIVTLLTICVLTLSACSNTSDTVTREEYENVVAEVEDLKSQIESLENSENNSNVDIPNSSTNAENPEPILSDEETQKEKVWQRDFSFEYDENNKIFISLYQDGRKWYLSGNGIYEEENLSLLQYERSIGFCIWIDMLGNEGHSIDLIFTVGEEEYSLSYSDGELTSDTVPLDSWDYGTFLTSKKYADKLNAYKEFDKFIHNE